MLSLHMRLSTSLICSFFFSNKRHHPSLCTSPIKCSEPLYLSPQSHHIITLCCQTHLNLHPQRTMFITDHFFPLCLHIMASVAVIHCSGSWALLTSEPILKPCPYSLHLRDTCRWSNLVHHHFPSFVSIFEKNFCPRKVRNSKSNKSEYECSYLHSASAHK